MFRPHFKIVFWGGEVSILSELAFRGKDEKMRHTRCIFLNISIQDCSEGTNNHSLLTATW